MQFIEGGQSSDDDKTKIDWQIAGIFEQGAIPDIYPDIYIENEGAQQPTQEFKLIEASVIVWRGAMLARLIYLPTQRAFIIGALYDRPSERPTRRLIGSISEIYFEIQWGIAPVGDENHSALLLLYDKLHSHQPESFPDSTNELREALADVSTTYRATTAAQDKDYAEQFWESFDDGLDADESEP